MTSGYAFDEMLGDIQHPAFIDGRIPIFGGEHFEGAFTVVTTNPLDEDGYRVSYGNSYIQAVTWNEQGVLADAFVTYSESTDPRSEEHTSELQSLMRISYAVFCLKKKNYHTH